MNHQLREKLLLLLEHGRLPESQVPKRFLEWTQSLLDTGVLRMERATRAKGRQLVVVDRRAVERFKDRAFPSTHGDDGLGSRVASIAQYRDTKTIRNTAPEAVLMRVNAGSPLETGREGCNPVDITRDHGVYAAMLDGGDLPRPKGRWVVIENPSVFHHHERLFGKESSAVLTHGRLSNKVLSWLGHSKGPDLELIHAPDYDPAGLSDHRRLHSLLGADVRLHVPEHIEALFARYGNRRLLLKGRQQAMLRALMHYEHEDVSRLCGLMRTYNAGLEQEALLVGDAGGAPCDEQPGSKQERRSQPVGTVANGSNGSGRVCDER